MCAGVEAVAELVTEHTQGRPWLQEFALVATDALECTLIDFSGSAAPTPRHRPKKADAVQQKLEAELAVLRCCCVLDPCHAVTSNGSHTRTTGRRV